jgi:hypothetical protein
MRDIEQKADAIRHWHGKGVQGIPLPSYNDLVVLLGQDTDTAAIRYMQDLLTAFWEQLWLYEILFDQLADFQLLKKETSGGTWMYFCPFCKGEEMPYADFFVHDQLCLIARVQQMRKTRQESKE